MQILTQQVSLNEPCYGLREGPVKQTAANGSQRRRWIQRLWVVRGDSLARYETDMGPASRYADVQELIIPSFGDDSVAELQYEADLHRHDTYWKGRIEEIKASSTLIADAVQQTEQRHQLIHNRSSFGPYARAQRDGFSLDSVERQISQRRQDYGGIIPQRGRA